MPATDTGCRGAAPLPTADLTLTVFFPFGLHLSRLFQSTSPHHSDSVFHHPREDEADATGNDEALRPPAVRGRACGSQDCSFLSALCLLSPSPSGHEFCVYVRTETCNLLTFSIFHSLTVNTAEWRAWLQTARARVAESAQRPFLPSYQSVCMVITSQLCVHAVLIPFCSVLNTCTLLYCVWIHSFRLQCVPHSPPNPVCLLMCTCAVCTPPLLLITHKSISCCLYVHGI